MNAKRKAGHSQVACRRSMACCLANNRRQWLYLSQFYKPRECWVRSNAQPECGLLAAFKELQRSTQSKLAQPRFSSAAAVGLATHEPARTHSRSENIDLQAHENVGYTGKAADHECNN